MKVKDRIRKWLDFPEQRRAVEASSRPPRMSGRASVDSETDVFVSALSMLAPAAPDYETYWRDFKLDAKTLDRVSTTKLMQLLADVSPDVSRALWDFLRLGNPGFACKAYRPKVRDGQGQKVQDERAQGLIDGFLATLHGPYAANNTVHANTVINSLLIACFLRGAMCAELVIDYSGRVPLEIATPDPASIRFRKINDTERGPVWQMGQFQRGEFVPLDRPTIAYVPVDPFPGSPYGRPLASPALFASLFLLGLLHDLRRVVAQQGYPRMDIKIISEKVKAMMPPDMTVGTDDFREWFDALMAEIVSGYENVEPDDAWVHSDVTELGRPVGTVDSSSLGAVDGLIKALERLLVRALKTFDLFFDTGDGGGDQANSNRKWELMAASIKSVQHLCENLLERLLTLALRIQGVEAEVEFRFSELRAAELLRDAQVEAFKIKNARAKYDCGYVSQDEAAEEVTGHKADVPEPRAAARPASNELPTGGTAADPGSERWLAWEQYLKDGWRVISGERGTVAADKWLFEQLERGGPNEDAKPSGAPESEAVN
jgi:hypothetical protein